MQGSSSPAIHKQLHYTRSRHDLPELVISVCPLCLNHSEMGSSSCLLPSAVCLLFYLWNVPGPQTSDLPLRHELASGLWCHLAGVHVYRLDPRSEAKYSRKPLDCLSLSVVFPGVLSPGRRRTSEAGPNLVKAYTAKPCSCILSSIFLVDCEEINVYIRLECVKMS